MLVRRNLLNWLSAEMPAALCFLDFSRRLPVVGNVYILPKIDLIGVGAVDPWG
jgi:hypothetical protein